MSGDRVRRRRPRARAAAIASVLFVLAGCAAAELDAEPPAPPARPAPGTVGAASSIAFAPLRGTSGDAAALAHPSLAVKVDNHVEARPHIGLNRADLVFEELVEGGITRYVAVWHSDVPEELGPVRSIRPMDPDIIAPFGGLVAYSGGQEQFVAMMQDTAVVNLVFDYDDTGLFWRADDRPGPHDVIIAASEAVRRHTDLPAPGVQFAYGAQDPLAAAPGAAPTSRIDAVFSDARYPSWEWEAASSTWLRSQEGEPDFEASGERVRATNVVTMRVDVDWSLGEVPRTVLVGEGEVWVSAAGRTAHGRWAKPTRESPIALTAEDGAPLRLAPGTTWIELVPLDGSVAFVP